MRSESGFISGHPMMPTRLLALAALLLIGTLAVTPASSTPLYRVAFGDNSVSSTTEIQRDTTFDIYTSNGTGDFVGAGFAGPARVRAFQRLDATWGGVFSGGNQYICNAQAQATDFVVTGGPGPFVTGTLNFWASADLSLGGGFENNNGHETQYSVRADITGYGNVYGTVLGSILIGNYGPQSSGCFAGMTSPHVSAPVSMTVSIPVGAPLNLIIFTQADGATYGNINVSPGFTQTDAGGDGTGPTDLGFRLDGSSGAVMTLPAGYTLDIPSWGVANNTMPNLVGVDPRSTTADVRLALAGANPTSADSRLSFSLAHDGVAHVIVFDLTGRTVRTLMDGWQNAGVHSLVWNGRDDGGAMAPAGLYFVRADAGGKHDTSRIARVR